MCRSRCPSQVAATSSEASRARTPSHSDQMMQRPGCGDASIGSSFDDSHERRPGMRPRPATDGPRQAAGTSGPRQAAGTGRTHQAPPGRTPTTHRSEAACAAPNRLDSGRQRRPLEAPGDVVRRRRPRVNKYFGKVHGPQGVG